MNYSVIKKHDIANGTGVRVSLFVSGCDRHCKGCFNPETWDFSYGTPFGLDTIDEIIEAMKPKYIQGLTILGGEPLHLMNQGDVYHLIKHVRAALPTKNIWCYTGYTLEDDLLDEHGQAHCTLTKELLGMIDVLVDGEFIEEKKNISLPFSGSENQRVIKLPETIASGKVVLFDLKEEWEKI